MILKTVYHMNLLDFRNFLLKNVLKNLFSHRVKSLKNNSCLSSHDDNNEGMSYLLDHQTNLWF